MANNLEKLLSVYLGQAQEAEDMLIDLLNKSGPAGNLFRMEGAQLDAYGLLVGEPRINASDPNYRKRIFGRILVNNSRGTINDIIDIASRFADALIGSVPTVQLTEKFPACYHISTGFLTQGVSVGRVVGDAIQRATAAGVCVYYFFDTSPNPFKFSPALVGGPPFARVKDILTGFGTQPVAGQPPTKNGPGGEFSSAVGP